jgi:hypothetical protein
MRALARALILVLALAGFAACGGGDDDESAGGGNAPARQIQPEAQERAEALNLSLSDFPDGWRASEGADDDEEGRDEFRACVGSDLSATTITGLADSDDFAMGETAEVTSAATIFESEQMASDALAETATGYESPEADECFTELIGNSSDEDFQVGEIEIGPMSFTPPTGVDEARAWQVVISVEGTAGTEFGEGMSATGYIDVVALREGDAVVFVQAFDFLTPFDPELRNQLIQAVADRMTG